MGETNSPLVAHVGYDISPLSRGKLKFLLSWVEKYRKPRATEGESIYILHFNQKNYKSVLIS
jgi:hypothetical protein